ncbi:hypothetical protein P7K49_010838 [Saguinus oedipus]|uniref:Uncharacterized protein n=1 Tax=Saguinus oedipus TaxID=9490 RepID=A0ABQ9VNY3_SAGOE|nr:hypothetical protein P7K49_010838 [Saguinus oedipus]
MGPRCEEDRQTLPTPPAQLQEFMPSDPLRQRPCPPPAWPDRAASEAQIEAHQHEGAPHEHRASPETQDKDHLSPGKVRLCIPWKHTSRSSVPPLHADVTIGHPRFVCLHFKHGSRDSTVASPGPKTTRCPVGDPEAEDEGCLSPGEVRLWDSDISSSSSSSGSSVPPLHADPPIRVRSLPCHFKHGSRDSAVASPGPKTTHCPLGVPEAQDEGRLSPGEVTLWVSHKSLSKATRCPVRVPEAQDEGRLSPGEVTLWVSHKSLSKATRCPVGVPEAQDEGRLSPGKVTLWVSHKSLSKATRCPVGVPEAQDEGRLSPGKVTLWVSHKSLSKAKRCPVGVPEAQDEGRLSPGKVRPWDSHK